MRWRGLDARPPGRHERRPADPLRASWLLMPFGPRWRTGAQWRAPAAVTDVTGVRASCRHPARVAAIHAGADCDRLRASQGRISLGGAVHSEAGVIPALSRNGDARPSYLGRGRARTPGLRQRPVLGGRAARSDAWSASQRTHFVLQYQRRMMIMRAFTRARPAVLVVAT